MSTREDFTRRASELIGGLAPRSVDLVVFVQPAVSKVDANKPREVRTSITGDGTDEYALPSPWLQAFSTISQVHILGSDGSDEEPIRLLPEDYVVEQDTSGDDQIRLLGYSPSSAESIVVFHTALHTVSTATSTILSQDEDGFTELVASLALRRALTDALSQYDQRTDSDRAAVDTAHVEQVRQAYMELKRTAYAYFGIPADAVAVQQATPRQASRSADRTLSSGTIRRYRHTHPSGSS